VGVSDIFSFFMRVNIEKSEMIMTAYFDQIYQTLAWFSRLYEFYYWHTTTDHTTDWHAAFWIGFEKRAPDIYDKL
jgi:hypothetical protein